MNFSRESCLITHISQPMKGEQSLKREPSSRKRYLGTWQIMQVQIINKLACKSIPFGLNWERFITSALCGWWVSFSLKRALSRDKYIMISRSKTSSFRCKTIGTSIEISWSKIWSWIVRCNSLIKRAISLKILTKRKYSWSKSFKWFSKM